MTKQVYLMPADYDKLPTRSGFNKKHIKNFLLFIKPVISMEIGELKTDSAVEIHIYA